MTEGGSVTVRAALDTALRPDPRRRIRWAALILGLVVFYTVSWRLAQIDPVRLVTGLPRLGHWIASAWPPKVDELPLFLRRIAETVAMAAIGTTIATLLAIPAAVLASRNITPLPRLYYPVRWFLNALRGIDSFVFALLFVAAVGLGPFAGVLGIGLHMAGSIAKLWSESIEAVEPGPLEAATMSGASRLKVIRYALILDVLPS